MRWAVGVFYVALIGFVVVAGGLGTGLVVAGAVIGLLVVMRTVEAGTAITRWSHLLLRGRRVSSSS